jgi:hypothetical protein
VRKLIRLGFAVALLGSLTLMGSAATAAPDLSRHNSPAAICFKTKASMGPRGAHVGDGIWFDASIYNCGRTTNAHWIMRLTAPCKGQAYRAEGRGRFLGGLGVHTPPNSDRIACQGVYRMIAKVFHDGQLVDRASRYLRVRP